MSNMKLLRVFVGTEPTGRGAKVCEIETPVGTSWKDLVDAVSQVVLGPEEERWHKVKEVRDEQIDSDTGGGVIKVTSTWESSDLQLWTHPSEACCPFVSVNNQDVPPDLDLYSLLNPDWEGPSKLDGDKDLATWWAGLPNSNNACRNVALKRLVAKACFPASVVVLESVGEGDEQQHEETVQEVPSDIREQVVMEGVNGLWELCAERDWALRLNAACLQALLQVLTGDLMRPMEVAAQAVWSLAALAVPRAALVKLGVVQALTYAALKAVAVRKQIEERLLQAQLAEQDEDKQAEPGSPARQHESKVSLETTNRIVFNCLGAMALLAVDVNARTAALEVSPKLQLLLDLAALGFHVPEPELPVLAPLQTLPSHIPSDPAAADSEPPADGTPEGAEGSADPVAAEAEAATDNQPGSEAAADVEGGESASGTEAVPGVDGAEAQGAAADEQNGSEGSAHVHHAEQPQHTMHSPFAALDGLLDAEQFELALEPEDQPQVHQQMAAEVLWAMVGRDRRVRVSLVEAGAIPALVALMQSSNQGVSIPAVLCLAALARDARDTGNRPGPAGADGVGSDMLPEGGIPGMAELVGGTAARAAAQSDGQQTSGGLDNEHVLYEDMCKHLGQHAGVKLLCDSGQAPMLITELVEHVQTLITSFGQDEDEAMAEHPLHTVLEACCTALWGAVAAQLLAESRPPPPPPPPEPPHNPMAHLMAPPKPTPEAAKPPAEPGPRRHTNPQLGWRTVSNLARLAGQLMAVIQDIQEQAAQATSRPGQHATGNNAYNSQPADKIIQPKHSVNSNSNHSQYSSDQHGDLDHARVDSGYIQVAHESTGLSGHHVTGGAAVDDAGLCLSSALYCIMSSLAAIHHTPQLLEHVYQQLLDAHGDISKARQNEADAQAALDKHKEEIAAKQASSKFYFMDDDEAETDRLDQVLQEKERQVDVLIEQLHELEDSLQAASEECVAVAQDALRCLSKTNSRVGAVQLAATAMMSAMAQTQHPSNRPSLDDPSQLFKGPFRPVMLEAGVLPDLFNVAHAPCCGSPHLTTSTRVLVATCVTHLLAGETPLPPHLLVACNKYMSDPQQPVAAQPHLAGAMWCLARQEPNRKGMLIQGNWGELIATWLQTGLRSLRHHHAHVQGVQGFFVPDGFQQDHEPGATHLTGSHHTQDEQSHHHHHHHHHGADGHSEVPGSSRRFNVPRQGDPNKGWVLDPSLQGLPHDILSGLEDHLATSLTGEVDAARQIRFGVMSLWLMLRQWLVENMSPMNTLASTDGLHVLSNTSWWTLKFTVDTPLTLAAVVSHAMSLLAEVATAVPDSDGSPAASLRELTLRCCWNLSSTHPVVAAHLVSLGLPDLLMATASSPTAGSSLVRTALAYILHLADNEHHVASLGGLLQVAQLLCMLVERALSSAIPGADGQGADVLLMEDAARGLARLGLTQEGRAAIKRAKAVRRLIAVIRMDNQALEAVIERRQAAGIPAWEQTQELVCPLRAINNLPISLTPEQAASAKQLALDAMSASGMSVSPRNSPSMQGRKSGLTGANSIKSSSSQAPLARANSAKPSGQRALNSASNPSMNSRASNKSAAKQSSAVGGAGHECADADHTCDQQKDQTHKVSGDAEAGLMSLWGLLNLSGYQPVQVAICKHGLYTLLRAVHRSADPLRSTTAAAVLANIHYHPDNATTLYKAELKLKHAALLQLKGPSPALDQSPAGKQRPSTARSLAVESDTSMSSPVKTRSSLAAASLSSIAPGEATTPRSRPGTARGTATDKGWAASVQLANTAMTESITVLQDLESKYGSPDVMSPRIGSAQDVSSQPPLSVQSVADPDSEKAYQEARISFLRWVVDPGSQSFDALDNLGAGGRAGQLTKDEMMTRLTRDPEELNWLEEQANRFFNHRHSQGSYLRGTFSRSLAQGATSLWHTKQQNPAKPSKTPCLSASSSPRASPRPSTAPVGTNRRVAGNVACSGHQHDHAGSQHDIHNGHASKAGETVGGHKKRNAPKGASNLLTSRCAAWRPHILAFVQDTMSKTPQVYLAQRLLVGAAPTSVINKLTGLSVDLFGNKVLTEGIKAMEETAAAEAAFQAAVEKAAQEERERMEAETRVLDTVRFDSMRSTRSVYRAGALSRAASVAVAKSNQREYARAASRAVSRAVSRRVSLALESSDESGSWELAAANRAVNSKQASKQHSKAGKGDPALDKQVTKRTNPGGGVRFGADIADHGDQQDEAAAGAVLSGQATDSTDAALAAAAAALVRSTGHDAASQQETALNARPSTQSTQNTASFVAGSLVRQGSLSTIHLAKSQAPSSLKPGAQVPKLPTHNLPGGATGKHAGTLQASTSIRPSRAISRANSLIGVDVSLSRSLGVGQISAETKWLGEDVKEALEHPHTRYHEPHQGMVSPAGTMVSTLKSEAYLELQDMLYPERAKLIRPVKLSEDVPRPTAVLGATVEDVITLGALKDALSAAGTFNQEVAQRELEEAEASVGAAQPFSIRVATGDGGPDKTYRFPRDCLYDPRHMVMFQHIEGSRYCESLYGHYLLPNGKLAHFVLGDLVRKGHQVDLEQAPEIPFSPGDWLMDGLPTTTAFTSWAVPNGPATKALLSPLWCPVPALSKVPQDSILEWEGGIKGGKLTLRSVCMRVTLTTIKRVDEETIEVEATIKKPKKKAAGAVQPAGAGPAVKK